MEDSTPVPRAELDIFTTKVARFLDPQLVLAVLNHVRAGSPPARTAPCRPQRLTPRPAPHPRRPAAPRSS